MARVERSDILDFLTYGERRDAIRASAMAAKALRRVHLGENLTFLFENVETIRYQVLEMVRVEQMVRESDIRHELDTYNAVLGEAGDLGCTLLIEIPDERLRADLLRRWRDLPDHIYMVFTDGSRAKARFDPAQMSEDKLSSVQFLQFPAGGRIPARVGVDLPGLSLETALDPSVQAALAADMRS
jgi:hypothetical protein